MLFTCWCCSLLHFTITALTRQHDCVIVILHSSAKFTASREQAFRHSLNWICCGIVIYSPTVHHAPCLCEESITDKGDEVYTTKTVHVEMSDSSVELFPCFILQYSAFNRGCRGRVTLALQVLCMQLLCLKSFSRLLLGYIKALRRILKCPVLRWH